LYPQLLAVRELEASELQSQLSEHSQASSAQQAADAAALAAQRAALTAAAGAEEARLRRKIQVRALWNFTPSDGWLGDWMQQA
jgi:hypothetical protein